MMNEKYEHKAILVTTQVVENYGLHCESDEPYWKFKVGDDYLVYGTTDRPANAVALVAALCMENGKGYKEFPVHHEVVSADHKTEHEQMQEEYDGEIKYPAKRIDIKDRKTWKKGDYDYENSFEKLVANW